MKRVALIGMPNTGKSTFFNRLTGANARIGNWPGITVDLYCSKLLLGNEMVELVDLPGIYEFPGYSDDERVVKQFLETTPVDLVLVILNASQIQQQIHLLSQLRHYKLPVVLLLNMVDEARQFGIRIDTDKLSGAIAAPVQLISAKYGEGVNQAKAVLTERLKLSAENDAVLSEVVALNEAQEQQIRQDSESLLSHSVMVPLQLPTRLTQYVDRLLLHPWLGLPLFF